MRVKVDQDSALPTRKVTAATLGAAAGGALSNLSLKFAATSPWLEWLAEPDVQTLVYALGCAVTAGAAGYCIRDTREAP